MVEGVVVDGMVAGGLVGSARWVVGVVAVAEVVAVVGAGDAGGGVTDFGAIVVRCGTVADVPPG